MPFEGKMKYAISVMTLITALSGTGTFLYTKMAWASDIVIIERSIESIHQEVVDAKRSRLEDQIFEKDFVIENGTATPLDKALNKRYKSQLKSLQTK